MEDYPAEVPNPHTLLSNLPPEAKYFTVIDLCSAFFSVPLAEESRYLFAFTYQGQQYAYTRMPQGFKHLPHIFNHVFIKDLAELNMSSTHIQYVDNLLICSETKVQCHADPIKVLTQLDKGGHKVPLAKLQYCLPQVEYLGQIIAQSTRAIAPTPLEGLAGLPNQ